MESIPTFTKLYIISSLAISLLIFTQSQDPYHISYTFKTTFFQLELWRPFTAILYLNRVSILLPVQIIFAYLASTKIAGKIYGRQTNAEMAWLFIFSIVCLMLFSTLVANLYFYGSSFIMIMLMVWAIQFPTDYISILKGPNISSVYFPIIYPAIMIFLGSSYKHYMAGLLIGLLFGTLRNPGFIRSNGDWLPVPKILKNFFREDFYQMERERVQITIARQPRNVFSGTGVRLG